METFKRIVPIVFGLVFLVPSASFAAVDMFLEVEGVQGESQDDTHKDAVDILAWSWGASNSYVGKRSCNVQDLSVTKYTDSASPAFLMAQVDGRYFEKATLTVRKASGDNPLEYIVIEFYNVRVSSLSTGGSGGEDRITENVTFEFSNATYTYTPQDPQGTPGTQIQADIGGC